LSERVGRKFKFGKEKAEPTMSPALNDLLFKIYYLLFFCKNVGMFIPFSTLLLVTSSGVFKPGTGACAE
jgi:hypothetical protein